MSAAQRLSAAMIAAVAAVASIGIWSLAEEPDPWTAAKGAPQAAAALYQQGLDAAHGGEFARALALFEKAGAEDKDNADILTMTAFCQRKLGQLDAAFAAYRRALALKPRNPQAREYLGEAHLQALLAEIETLRGYGAEGKEPLEHLKKAVKDATAKL
jgi:Tfp pilus assembly protein PilF